jgi:DNA-binding LacI/PurR family transcriptional regulator
VAAAFASPALSTVRFPKAELGRTAWSLLRDRLDGRPPQVCWLAPELVLRGSTAVASSRLGAGVTS